MHLCKISRSFEVERRRIYDIVNIYESLKVMRKVQKNHYCWRGLKQAVKTITAIINKEDLEYLPKDKKPKSL